MGDYAESTTQGLGRTEDGQSLRSHQPRGEEGSQDPSRGSGDIGRGIFGTSRSSGIQVDPITGGILSQLIKQVEGQLAESKECVDWYERKTKEYQDQLDQLKHLQGLMESEFTE